MARRRHDLQLPNEPQAKLDDEALELIRPTGGLENLFVLHGDHGVQSSVLVLATYSSKGPGAEVLEPALVHTALSLVIERHPALSVIIRREPSTTKKVSTRAWLAKLKTIDLEECVSFLDNCDDSQPGMAQVFEDQHNSWFDTDSTTKPLWRVVVVNRRHAVSFSITSSAMEWEELPFIELYSAILMK